MSVNLRGPRTVEDVKKRSLRSPLRHLDVPAVSEAARRESRNREIHLPPVSVYRWWARRTESVNGAIIEAFERDLPGKRLLVVDPFSGGGVIPLAAVQRGHRTYAQDINPWAAHGLVATLSIASPEDLEGALTTIAEVMKPTIQSAYATEMLDGTPAVVAHTFRVMTARCQACQAKIRLFPHSLIMLLTRKERGRSECFLACPEGHVFKGDYLTDCACPSCQ